MMFSHVLLILFGQTVFPVPLFLDGNCNKPQDPFPSKSSTPKESQRDKDQIQCSNHEYHSELNSHKR